MQFNVIPKTPLFWRALQSAYSKPNLQNRDLCFGIERHFIAPETISPMMCPPKYTICCV